jgi:hypothetical protein
MKFRNVALASMVAVFLFSPRRLVEACGPEWESDVFVRADLPDDLGAFAEGHLGIVQPGFDSNEYAVAWRYLTGSKLSADERSAYVPAPPQQPDEDLSKLTPAEIEARQEAEKQSQQNAQPSGDWLTARNSYAAAQATALPNVTFSANDAGSVVLGESYPNCPEPAFANAALTLDHRAHTWGRQSPYLLDWIQGQDAVFSNCAAKPGGVPAPAPAGSPALLKADRAYELASATFYAKRFDDAATQFEAIAADANSPWSQWGVYLAARATVRKAFAMGKVTDPYSGNLATYDADTMAHAQKMLEGLLAEPHPAPSRAAIEHELNFIRIRTEPGARAAEICAALSGPAPDANFNQDLEDLSWILAKQIKIEEPLPPLLAWIAAWRGSGTAASAFALWQRDHAMPWLVMALVKAGPSDSFAPQLLDAAAKIPSDAPAYYTVFYHRVRLLTALHREDEARALLDRALPPLMHQPPSSLRNALLDERMAVARSFSEFLAYAPRTTLETGSSAADDVWEQCNEATHTQAGGAPCPVPKQSPAFDDDGVTVLNRFTPLAQLIDAANAPTLPANLRLNLAVMAWTRSVLLADATSAAKLAPLLPEPLRKAAGSGVGFAADLAILRNPGIRPYLESGVPRVASYSYFDNYHDNWWCKPWNDTQSDDASHPKPASLPSFLTPELQSRGASDYQRLIQLPDSASLVGQRVIDYAQAHPDDPEVPEALALTVRATHYACQNWSADASGMPKSEYTPVSRAAFELLHRNYPQSPWALKTRYYY